MCKLPKIYIVLIFEFWIEVITMEDYHVGDTLNVFNQINLPIRDIFNGYNGSKYLKKENVRRNSNYRVSSESCLPFESLKQHFYPEVYIDGEKATSISSKLFNYLDSLRNQYLGIDRNYVNNNFFRYGFVKLCQVIEIQSLDIDLIGEKDFPRIYEGISYNILRNRTAVFRLRRDDETHYVSSISTGTCLVQISLREKTFCKSYKAGQSLSQNNEFFTNPVYRSYITTTSKNIGVEEAIDSYFYLNDMTYSLYSFSDLSSNHQENILNKLKDTMILNFELQSFPEISIHQMQMIVQLSNKIKPENIIPGGVLNFEELIDNKIRNISVNNVLIDIDNYVIAPFVTSNYESCFEQDKNGGLNFRTGEYKYFEQRMRSKNYGVNQAYATENATCLKIIICSDLRKQDLYLSTLNIVELNEKSKDHMKKNIFEDEDIMLLFSERNKTHIVTQTQKGNCLLQVLIYPFKLSFYTDNSRIGNYAPIYKGRILSVTNNRTLERWAKTLTKNDLRSVIGDGKNVATISAILGELHSNNPTNNALISLYLKELY